MSGFNYGSDIELGYGGGKDVKIGYGGNEKGLGFKVNDFDITTGKKVKGRRKKTDSWY